MKQTPGLKTLPKLGLVVLVVAVLPRAIAMVGDLLAPLVPAFLVALAVVGVWWVASRLRHR